MASRRTRTPAIVTLDSPVAPDPPASPERHVRRTSPETNDILARLTALEKGHRNVAPTPAELSDDEPSDNDDSGARAFRPARRDPKIAAPETFDGKPAKFANFMAQCTLHITLCTSTYRTDEQRVLFVISYLRDEPLTWAREIVNNPNHQLRHNYDAFREALTNS